MAEEYRREGIISLIPRASQPAKKFGEFSFEELKALTTELTEEEKASPYADLYDKGNVLTKEQQAAVDGPSMDVCDAFEPWEYAEKMNHTRVVSLGYAFSAAPEFVTEK